MANALFDIENGLQLANDRGFFSANGNAVVNSVQTSGGLYWTGNGKAISGITITASATPPTSPPPSIGDQWYNTSNDVTYQYQFDGTSTYWVDISSTVITANSSVPAINTLITDSIRANVGAYQTWANGQITTIDANLGVRFTTLNTLNANVGAYQIWANANLSIANISHRTLHANVGAYQIWANANVSSLQSQIDALAPASISEFQTYANSKIGTNTNSNLVVVATTSSTNTTTGALVVAGGVGVAENIYAANVVTSSGLINNLIVPSGTFTLGSQVFYTQGTNGFSVNENFDPSNNSDQTVYHFTSGAGRANIAFSLARSGQFTDGFGVYGTSADNTFVTFGEQSNTSFEWRKGIGIQPLNLSGGTQLMKLSSAGNLVIPTATASTSNTTGALVVGGGVGITGNINLTYNPATPTGSAIQLTGKDTQGGTGYFDFLKATNTTSGATNPNKTFRLSSIGGIELINSAYTTAILSLSDAGAMNVSGSYQVSGKKAVNGPAFSAYAEATLQTITSGSQQKVLFQTEEFDTDGCYASSRFTPTVEGYYQLNAQVRLDGASGTGEMMIILYKNGAQHKRGTNQQGTQIAANFWAMQVSSLVYANGTTDYFEIYVQQGLGTSVTVTAVNNPAITWFNGAMVRGA